MAAVAAAAIAAAVFVVGPPPLILQLEAAPLGLMAVTGAVVAVAVAVAEAAAALVLDRDQGRGRDHGPGRLQQLLPLRRRAVRDRNRGRDRHPGWLPPLLLPRWPAALMLRGQVETWRRWPFRSLLCRTLWILVRRGCSVLSRARSSRKFLTRGHALDRTLRLCSSAVSDDIWDSRWQAAELWERHRPLSLLVGSKPSLGRTNSMSLRSGLFPRYQWRCSSASWPRVS